MIFTFAEIFDTSTRKLPLSWQAENINKISSDNNIRCILFARIIQIILDDKNTKKIINMVVITLWLLEFD
jgi:hypothetical protein